MNLFLVVLGALQGPAGAHVVTLKPLTDAGVSSQRLRCRNTSTYSSKRPNKTRVSAEKWQTAGHGARARIRRRAAGCCGDDRLLR